MRAASARDALRPRDFGHLADSAAEGGDFALTIGQRTRLVVGGHRHNRKFQCREPGIPGAEGTATVIVFVASERDEPAACRSAWPPGTAHRAACRYGWLMSPDRETPVVLSRIYTRTGDDGTTALGDMSRASKTDPRLAAYADTDEANCAIGVAVTMGQLPADISQLLLRIQNELFDVGADLCNPVTENPAYPAAAGR